MIGIRRVTDVLRRADSCYLPEFASLRETLVRETALAADNLRFLALLQQPCAALQRAAPKVRIVVFLLLSHRTTPLTCTHATAMQDIPATLPQILKRVRLLWSLSAFYASPQRLTGLLRRVSNQLIVVCTAAVSVPDALCGNATAVLAVLQVHCGTLIKSLTQNRHA